MSFPTRQTEMRCEHNASVTLHGNGCLDEPTSLTTDEGEVVQVLHLDGPSTQQQVAVAADATIEKRAIDRLHNGGLFEQGDDFAGLIQRDLLQCDQVGAQLRDDRGDPVRGIDAVSADAVVHVIGGDAQRATA